MKKRTLAIAVGSAIALGFAVGLCTSVIGDFRRVERAVALRWDDTQSNVAQAQAHVYLKPGSHKEEVKLAVYFGRDRRWTYGPRTLGWVRTREEAVVRWGQIEWRADGLYVGTGPNQFFVTRDHLTPK